MRLLIYTAVWKRPEITEICFMGINRLKKCSPGNIEAFAVISEPEMIPLCEKYSVNWCMCANHPLGAKKNYGVRQALRMDFDYMIEIGSDDLLKDDALDAYTWDMPVIGLMDFAIINTQNGQCKSFNSNIPKYGSGRAIQRWVLESFKLWEDSKSRGMDNSSCRLLAENKILQNGVICARPTVIALKSDMNLWSYNLTQGSKYPLEYALNGLSDEEINAIRCLITKNKSEDLIGA